MTIPVYDVSGTKCVPGVTDFTVENVLAALRYAGITERRKLFATVPVAVHDKLQTYSLLHEHGDKTMFLQFELTINHAAGCGVICDSFLTDGKTDVILRTREY